MSDRGPHLLAEDLDESWFEDLVTAGIAALESYLAKYAAFLGYLDSQDS
jgi:hypothetical protein